MLSNLAYTYSVPVVTPAHQTVPAGVRRPTWAGSPWTTPRRRVLPSTTRPTRDWCGTRGPHYTMRPLTRCDWEDRNKPGPGAYSPERKSGAAAYSMGIKHSEFTAPLILDCDEPCEGRQKRGEGGESLVPGRLLVTSAGESTRSW